MGLPQKRMKKRKKKIVEERKRRMHCHSWKLKLRLRMLAGKRDRKLRLNTIAHWIIYQPFAICWILSSRTPFNIRIWCNGPCTHDDNNSEFTNITCVTHSAYAFRDPAFSSSKLIARSRSLNDYLIVAIKSFSFQILMQPNCEKIQPLLRQSQNDYSLAMLVGAVFSCFGIILILLAFVLWR